MAVLFRDSSNCIFYDHPFFLASHFKFLAFKFVTSSTDWTAKNAVPPRFKLFFAFITIESVGCNFHVYIHSLKKSQPQYIGLAFLLQGFLNSEAKHWVTGCCTRVGIGTNDLRICSLPIASVKRSGGC
jgi:hypothetical protein